MHRRTYVRHKRNGKLIKLSENGKALQYISWKKTIQLVYSE